MVTNANRILLSGDYVYEEKTAGGTIKPGHLIERYNSSGTELVRVHSTAKGHGENLVALEDALQGNTIDDDYSATDLVACAQLKPGTRAQMWLYPGTAYVVGDRLISKGDGTLQKVSGTADLKVFATLDEACDLSASGAVTTRADVTIN